MVKFKRAFTALLLSFFCGCTPASCCWEKQSIESCYPAYRFKKIVYDSKCELDNIKIELTKSIHGIRLYASILALETRPLDWDFGKTAVNIEIEEASFEIIVERFEGGQHMLFPEFEAQMIIEALLNGKTVAIKIGRYQLTLLPCNFISAYRFLNV